MATNKETSEVSNSAGKSQGQVAQGSQDEGSASSYKPVWEAWICRSELTLEQAVALSCDIEPEALRAPEQWGFGDDDEEAAKLNLYGSRLEIARGEAAAGVAFKVRQGRDKDGRKTSLVRMVAFARWAIALSKLPTVWRGLPTAFELLASGSPAPKWPWGDRSTELLDHLVEASNLWKDYDSSNPASAPTQEEVVEFLGKRKWKGKLISGRVAKVMAQLLQADDLRPGPHTNS